MKYDLKEILSNFQIEGEFVRVSPYGSGHINDTFVADCNRNGVIRRYILQRINHNIFKNPPELMDNIVRVTEHIRKKLKSQGAEDIDRRVLTLIPADDGGNYYLDTVGDYWRVYIFLEGARTYDVLENLEQARQAAKAFGQFQEMLVDLPQPPLFETIPDFHNGPKRYLDFEQALRDDRFNRAASAEDEIDFLNRHSYIFDILPELIANGKIPKRISHNDTKINNVMIDDETNQGICVIDLDTVMPGSALYDYGDIVRTTVSSAQEDEPDLSKVYIETDRFESITGGYLSAAGNFLNKAEKEHLVHSAQLVTLMVGTRFLTDYLVGDVYFKIHKPGHNLQRCKSQFKRVESLIENADKLDSIVKSYVLGQ